MLEQEMAVERAMMPCKYVSETTVEGCIIRT
jgi:hypothetical protein